MAVPGKQSRRLREMAPVHTAAAMQNPRHGVAGLIIEFDLCPVTPGSFTRLFTPLQLIECVGLAQS
jgi:hypothetical protein